MKKLLSKLYEISYKPDYIGNILIKGSFISIDEYMKTVTFILVVIIFPAVFIFDTAVLFLFIGISIFFAPFFIYYH